MGKSGVEKCGTRSVGECRAAWVRGTSGVEKC